DRSQGGEEVFRESRSLVLKSLRVRRVFDEANQTLIYLVHARQLTQDSAKMSISTVPLFRSGPNRDSAGRRCPAQPAVAPSFL
ncbi:CreA family protein, partial [Rhodovulum sp.]|uniref:CreA family protein n=1 Tax=Rhodovulum sp. TaxID=34009 RepID=UPI0017C2125D